MDQLDCVIVGAGVIGLAVGRAMVLAGREVVVLEAEPEIGMHTSSRNSEVIHAGIYYGEGTLKARLCVRGKEMLYDYCATHHVPFNRLGKLSVATGKAEIRQLEALRAKAARNGVADLRMLGREEARSLEPHVTCDAALLSPSTGIVDSHALMLALQGEIEAHGSVVLTRSRVADIKVIADGFELGLAEGTDRFACTTLINAGGLFAGDVAGIIEGYPGDSSPEVHYAIGHYFAYQGKSPFRHLVYPVPVDGGLGIHATCDMGGSLRFGPDVEWIDNIDYNFDASRRSRFAEAVRRYYPDIDEARLVPAYTGIRPKLSRPGEPPRDFLIQDESAHGVTGLVNLFGIESPGLTAALAIGEYVGARLSG
ncbi:MAG: NAD(P)/FAD-dependent oxidoreductase [Woeseiaceae bacterium]